MPPHPGKRILALDLGEARIGLAVSDLLGLTAQPLERLEVRNLGMRRRVQAVAAVLAREAATEVVIGFPLLLSGMEGTGARAAKEFGSALEAEVPGVPVHFQDERLTTVQAERVMISGKVRRRKRKEKVDSLAAVLILQAYLDGGGSGAGGSRAV